ncbi:hypothetical protein GCM10011494_26530 [Novosphingobium endophyticum]|uniref:MobA/MobL protein domain-containing protein n=1 Tax=Novosphingobium endophyticum TaxID=1955250 RepID=A0A916X676_9SPHN|nr:Ti-type conjugative transfer relaxase TraA [Novosphingobium endophyticum]GGC06608.1 hypothetical protein GCM10011494_26530 [Novosphingobium endophyticum]
MAIYHFSVQVIGRKAGRSAVSAAAYRAGQRLHDERLDRTHDFRARSGVEHSEILLPEGAPERFLDREQLWNEVEAVEVRKDAQLAREVEFAIPREMTRADGIELARDFVQTEFVDRGMIADLNVHCDIGVDGQPKPHAHVMLTLREVGEDGFGAKVREWNEHANVGLWRERWETHVNARLAELDIDARIDHRSLEAQGIDLEPQAKIGAPAQRMERQGQLADRAEIHREIARENGARIIANPRLALDAITHSQATFTTRDMAMFVHRHSDGAEQFNAAMSAVRGSPDLIALGKDGLGQERFTSREMIETEQRLSQAAELMAQRERHRVPASDRDGALARAGQRGLDLSGEQRAAFEHVTDRQGLSVVVGYAGTGKSAMLGVAREAWEDAGLNVRGAALSGIAAEGLENGSGIASRTIASLELQWSQGRDLPTSRDVLVIDEAGMVGTRQMERVLTHAQEAGAKVVLVGDASQLQAIEAGAAFRSIAERHGAIEIGEVRRQHADWQREATRQLATGRTAEALRGYEGRGMVHAAPTRETARDELVERWDRERRAEPGASRIILTHTNDEVRSLNDQARGRLRVAGELGAEVTVRTERGERSFAPGDRVMFLRNERSLGVKNGTLGEVERVSPGRMAVRLDDGRSAAFDVKDYAHVDHGYAATIHKAQGMTVNRAHVLATPGMDRHSSYVALSRHRDGVQLHYGRDDFRDTDRLARVLARERAKDMASDYARADPARTYAERRGITVRERAAEHLSRASRGIIRKAPEKARSIPSASLRGAFANFRPKPYTPEVAPPPQSREADVRRAVERYARVLDDIGCMRVQHLPVLPHQREALDRARAGLDAIGPQARADLQSAFERRPDLVGPAARGNSQAAIRAMQIEAGIRTDPFQRADRFVEGWQRLQRQRDMLLRGDNREPARKVASDMGMMAKSLERDPQVESLLRDRKRALGIDMHAVRPIGRELMDIAALGRERSRGLEIGM